MKRIISILFGSSLFIILLYLLFSDVEHKLLEWLNSPISLAGYAALSFCFLLSDILLPVPSSLVMILNGKVLGVFWGTWLSLVSGLASSTIGYFLGSKSGPFLNRFFSKKELRTGDYLFARYGKGAIALSKALPILSESLSFLSGTTNIGFRRFLMFSFCGHAVISLVYAYVGSMARTYDSNLISGIIILGVLALAWILQWMIRPKRSALDNQL